MDVNPHALAPPASSFYRLCQPPCQFNTPSILSPGHTRHTLASLFHQPKQRIRHSFTSHRCPTKPNRHIAFISITGQRSLTDTFLLPQLDPILLYLSSNFHPPLAARRDCYRRPCSPSELLTAAIIPTTPQLYPLQNARQPGWRPCHHRSVARGRRELIQTN